MGLRDWIHRLCYGRPTRPIAPPADDDFAAWQKAQHEEFVAAEARTSVIVEESRVITEDTKARCRGGVAANTGQKPGSPGGEVPHA